MNEAIPLDEVGKRKLSRKHSGAYAISRLDEIFQGEDRLVYDIDLTAGDVIISENPLIDKIFQKIHKNYNITIRSRQDYIKGVAYDIMDNEKKQPRRIGKLLNKLAGKGDNEAKQLLKEFNEDPTRATKGRSDYKVVISRHPYDVAGMSTDRNWTSCMNLGTPGIHYKTGTKGQYQNHVRIDILRGSIVAYLVEDSDRHPNGKLAVNRPLSRILMKPHVNVQDSSDYAWSQGRTYGAPVGEFSEFVKNWLKKEVNVNTEGKKYAMEQGLYRDGDVAVNFETARKEKLIAEEVFFEVLGNSTDENYFRFFEVDAGEAFYQGREAEIKITFDIPENVQLLDFRYDRNDNRPQYINNILNVINLTTKSDDYSANFQTIESFLDTRQIVMEFVIADPYFEIDTQEAEYWDDDQEAEYWEQIFKNVSNVGKFDYGKVRNQIIDILKNFNVEAVKREEKKAVYDEFKRISKLPEVKRAEDKLTPSLWKKADEKVDYFHEMRNMDLFEINEKYETPEFHENAEFLKDFMKDYNEVGAIYFRKAEYRDDDFDFINAREKFKEYVTKQMDWNMPGTDFFKKLFQLSPNLVMMFNKKAKGSKEEFFEQYGRDRFHEIFDLLTELQQSKQEYFHRL